MNLQSVGILGAGTMGCGIAQVVAQAGLQARILDVSEEVVQNAIDRIKRGLSKIEKAGKMSLNDKEEIIGRVFPCKRIEELRDSDMVIESAVEDLKIKTTLFNNLSDVCPPETLFASNTSTLSITQIGAAVSAPERFLGLHFFNPASAMRLIEVIPGLQTSGATVQLGVRFVEAINKIPIVAQDCPGFLVNRIFMPYIGEALLAAQEGAATPHEIDQKMKEIGFPMGPLVLNDLVGIDVGLHTFPILHEAYGERFPIPLLLSKLFNSDRLGTKVGKGIYANGKVDDEFVKLIGEIQNETNVRNTVFSPDRLLMKLVNEAVYCLHERIATAEDIDRAMVLGTGFPVNELGVGGPLHFADELGLDRVLARLNHFKHALGNRFLPHFLLSRYVAAGRLGKKVKRGFFDYP